MSAEREESADETPPVEITLRRGEDADVWIAEDTATGVVSQGDTRVEALENLDEAVAGYHGAGESPSEDDLTAVGIDPASNSSQAPDESDPFDP